ncbi:hypothetical protein D3C86_1030300 [compost metagenome]
MLGDSENSLAMVGIAMDSDTRSIRLTMVSAKMIAKIRQRTLLALAVAASGFAAAADGASAPGRCREALGRAMVRTSFYYFCGDCSATSLRRFVSTIEGSAITV